MRTWMWAIFVTLIILAPSLANAGIIGLYLPAQDDKVSVFVTGENKNPHLRVEVPRYPDVALCKGFQPYRKVPFARESLELENGPLGRGTGFALWESQECLEALWATNHVSLKEFTQEIDIYNDFFAYFTNHEELVRGFEAGDFVLAVGFQITVGFEQEWREAIFTYEDALVGRVLLGQRN
ncbi:MAG: hypothetical protein HY455_00340 [Parcubacteria group bacterium]|nr:hypothetical protein [Parcubacteria group bacterium]